MNPVSPICCLSFISGAGGGELIVIFLVILVLFGPRKLPEIARIIGKTISQLRTASQEFRDEVMKIEDEVQNDIKSAAIGCADDITDEMSEPSDEPARDE